MWVVRFDENGGYDCMTDAFTVTDWRGRVVGISITLDLAQYGQTHSWNHNGDFESAWHDACCIREALNARDYPQGE